MKKFKIGDKVIANAKANHEYGITREGWIGTVIGYYGNEIRVQSEDGKHQFTVRQDCFDLYNEVKYKIGDRVQIREWSDMKKEFGLDADGHIKCRVVFVKKMKHLCGRAATVTDVRSNGIVRLDFDDKSGDTYWGYSVDMLRVANDEKKIVITTDGKTTTAKLYDGNAFVKEAVAKCSPSDTFEFNVGATLALSRLTEKPKTLRDVVAERQPDCVGSKYAAGASGCPHDYSYLGVGRFDGCSYPSKCDECWSRPYKPEQKPEKSKFTKADLKTGMFVLVKDEWAVVVNDSLVYEKGQWDKVSSLSDDLCFTSRKVEAVVEAKSFKNARLDLECDSHVLYRRNAVQKTMHIVNNRRTDYGEVGKPTEIKDINGEALFVGDMVELFNKDMKSHGLTPICNDKEWGDFVMGIACDSQTGSYHGEITGGWKIIKRKSHKDVTSDDMTHGLKLAVLP